MKITKPFLQVRDGVRRADDAILLLLRLNVGVLFMTSGWGKIHDLASVTTFFAELHIPLPAFNAVLVASTELIGGALLIVGLATRLAALPLAFTMLIAIITAKLDDIGGIADVAATDEVTYGLVLLTLAVFGPGKLALDRLIEAALASRARASRADRSPGDATEARI